MLTEKQINNIAINFEDEIFDEVYKKKYDKYTTVKELQVALNDSSLFSALVDYLVEYRDVDYEIAEDMVVDNNLLYKVLWNKNTVELLKRKLGVDTMNCHKPMPRHKNSIEKLENSVRRMF